MRRVGWGIVFLLLIFLSLQIGSTSLSWENIVSGKGNDAFILWSARIPRTITVLLAGAGLALSGMVMQTLTQNRFAAPDTIGTIESAKLGLLTGMVLFPNLSVQGKMAISFLFAVVGTLIFLLASSRFGVKSQLFIPLMGLMYGNIIGGFGNFLAFRYNVLQNLQAWTQGNFSLIIEGQYEGMYLTLFLIGSLYLFADYLTISRFGKEAAQSLGLPFQAVLVGGTFLVSLTVAVILVTAGTLPFLGVIVPNIVSLRYGDNIRNTHQKNALMGAFFLLACDLFSRTIIRPYEVPVALILGIIGGAVFLWLLSKRGRTV